MVALESSLDNIINEIMKTPSDDVDIDNASLSKILMENSFILSSKQIRNKMQRYIQLL